MHSANNLLKPFRPRLEHKPDLDSILLTLMVFIKRVFTGNIVYSADPVGVCAQDRNQICIIMDVTLGHDEDLIRFWSPCINFQGQRGAKCVKF